jgi:hypothetical protein
VDKKDPKALATRADELWALHDNPCSGSSTVAVVQPDVQEVDFVAAVKPGKQRGKIFNYDIYLPFLPLIYFMVDR